MKGVDEMASKCSLQALVLILAMIGPCGLASARADQTMIEDCLKAAAELNQVLAGSAAERRGRAIGRGQPEHQRHGDIGPMQVNDTWVRKIGHWRASPDAALLGALRDNFCANVEGGAWILRQALDEAHGDLWKGVALYHSHDPSISSNICGSSMRRRCGSSASFRAGAGKRRFQWERTLTMARASRRSGRDRQRRLHRLQPDPDLRRARDPRLDGMEAVACGNQRGRADRRPSRDAGDRLGFGSLLAG